MKCGHRHVNILAKSTKFVQLQFMDGKHLFLYVMVTHLIFLLISSSNFVKKFILKLINNLQDQRKQLDIGLV